MPTAVREQLLDAITTAVTGEYALPLPVDEGDLPWTSVQEGDEQAEDDGYGQTAIELEVVIGRAAPAASTDRAALRAQGSELLAGIIVDMASDETFGGLADTTNYTGGIVTAELGRLCIVAATFVVKYHTVRGDPYNID